MENVSPLLLLCNQISCSIEAYAFISLNDRIVCLSSIKKINLAVWV